MHDIIDAIANISHRFRSANLEPPAVVLLKDHEQGMRLLHALHQMPYITVPMGSDRGGKVTEHPDGSVWMEVEVYGMKLRWPAKQLAKPEGGFVWY